MATSSPVTASSPTTQCEVLVIGAGLAGLQCARTLEQSGVDVVVWEAADDVGGRIRTDEVDGFLMDRGFQVLNPAYPAVQQHIDLPALNLQPFGAGAQVRDASGLEILAHPLREPRYIPELLSSGYLKPAPLLALARWAGPALGLPRRLIRSSDQSTAQAMDDAGLTGPLRDVAQAFLAGVVLEDDGSTSANFVRLLLRMFVLGVPGVPQGGMQALPEQVAAQLATPVRTRMRVTAIDPDKTGVTVRTPSARPARSRRHGRTSSAGTPGRTSPSYEGRSDGLVHYAPATDYGEVPPRRRPRQPSWTCAQHGSADKRCALLRTGGTAPSASINTAARRGRAECGRSFGTRQ